MSAELLGPAWNKAYFDASEQRIFDCRSALQGVDQSAVDLASNRQTLMRLKSPNCGAGLRPRRAINRTAVVATRRESGLDRLPSEKAGITVFGIAIAIVRTGVVRIAIIASAAWTLRIRLDLRRPGKFPVRPDLVLRNVKGTKRRKMIRDF
jgi:hypothetical protein